MLLIGSRRFRLAQPWESSGSSTLSNSSIVGGPIRRLPPKPVKAAACEQTASHRLDLTLTEGKYHQVKRMLAAVGNRVEGLHRSQIGALVLPADLPPGAWKWLSQEDLSLLAQSS